MREAAIASVYRAVDMARKILVVDDEPHVTHVLAYVLRRLGDEVFTASDGDQALISAQENVPDLIIADYFMPALDGLEVCAKLLQDPRTAGIPVVMLTARTHSIGPAQLAASRVRCLVAKPFSPRELVAKVAEIIGPPAGRIMPNHGNKSVSA